MRKSPKLHNIIYTMEQPLSCDFSWQMRLPCAFCENRNIPIRTRGDVKRFAAIRQKTMSITASHHSRVHKGGFHASRFSFSPSCIFFFSGFLARKTHLFVNGERYSGQFARKKCEFARCIKTNGIFHKVRLPVTSRRF